MVVLVAIPESAEFILLTTVRRMLFSSLLKFVLLNPCDFNARHFPLWKRGTKGDLRSLSTREC